MLSPVNRPANRLPVALRIVHAGLPVRHTADSVRGRMTAGLVDDLALRFAIVGTCARSEPV